MARVTDSQLEAVLAVIKENAQKIGIESAKYWVVQNPYGPRGLHLLERHHDDGNWVSQNTAIGTHTWETKAEALKGLRTISSTLYGALYRVEQNTEA